MQTWIHGNRVTRVYTCTFKVLHNTRNQDIFTITDGINLNFTTHHILINQYRVFYLVAGDDLHILPNILFAVCNLHSLTAEHIGRTHQNRIPQTICNSNCFLLCKHGFSLWTRNSTFFQNLIKFLAILRCIDRPCLCTQNRYTQLFQMCRQINRCLSTKLYNGCIWLFCAYNALHIFRSQRLKVQAICCVKVCRNGFRIVIDDNRLAAQFLQRPNRMY